ncbi:MAG: zinc ribbon domain-containing protein, partial [Peptococcales bacterium]
ETKKNEQEKNLYAGNCTNPKELSGMKVKLEVIKAQISQLEDQILMNMDILEDKNQLLNRLRGQVEEIKKVYIKGVKIYKKNKEELNEAKISAEKRQLQLSKVLSGDLLQKYQRIQKNFKNRGIARVENGICSGCRVEIPILHLKNIKEGNNIYICEQCGRILISGEA